MDNKVFKNKLRDLVNERLKDEGNNDYYVIFALQDEIKYVKSSEKERRVYDV